MAELLERKGGRWGGGCGAVGRAAVVFVFFSSVDREFGLGKSMVVMVAMWVSWWFVLVFGGGGQVFLTICQG